MKRIGTVLALVALVMVLTWIVGWWAVLGAATAWGALHHRERGGAGLAALAAALAWAVLLAFDALDGRLGTLAALMGGIFPLPGVALLVFTLAFAAAGAWSAAVIGGECRLLMGRRMQPLGPTEQTSTNLQESRTAN